ncbi:NUDIX hydrolase [Halostella salina]|uniref:NUDIX hydrolase n=1 Tax=Halostella salina TaxID=1547897 RepID=UPI000EF7F1BC|nr:NUDIX domain-containing protein [Halostella salina]
MYSARVRHVPKVCAYLTRGGGELLVFEGPEYDGLQVPKGTVEPDETPVAALFREVEEESGLRLDTEVTCLARDVWTRRRSPPKRYVRHFFHATVDEPRDRWTHTVTGDGDEEGLEFAFSWVDLPPAREFAFDLDDYVHLLASEDADRSSSNGEQSDVTARERTSTSTGRRGR